MDGCSGGFRASNNVRRPGQHRRHRNGESFFYFYLCGLVDICLGNRRSVLQDAWCPLVNDPSEGPLAGVPSEEMLSVLAEGKTKDPFNCYAVARETHPAAHQSSINTETQVHLIS